MKKRFNIYRNDETEFDGTISAGVVAQIVEQNSGQISAPTQQTINGHAYNFAGWSDWTNSNPKTIWPNDNETYSALYKVPQNSNQSNGFGNSSQRKFVRTPDFSEWGYPNGMLHKVYQSMNRVWYELSSNNGVTWQVWNNGLPISNFESANPSIAYNNQGLLAMVFESKNSSNNYELRLQVYKFLSTGYSYRGEVIIPTANSSFTSTPTIALDDDDKIYVVFKGKFVPSEDAGLKFWYGRCNGSHNFTQYSTGYVLNSSAASSNPSISRTFNSGVNENHLVWQEEDSDIMLLRFGFNSSYQMIENSFERISSGSGYLVNASPSLTVLDDNISRICWKGSREEESTVVFTASDNTSHYWTFGSEVESPTITRNNNSTLYIISWSESGGSITKMVDNSLNSGNIKEIPISGRDVQICNGVDKSRMYAVICDNTLSSAPYPLIQSDKLSEYYVPINKEKLAAISEGREGIVAKNKLQFYFGVGDVKVDNELVSFKEIADSVRFSNLQTLNQYLTTEPFPLTDNSSFYYSVQFGVTDTSYAQNSLSANSFVKFRVLLLDDNTNQLLGVYDEVTYTLDNLLQHKNIAYQVNTNGIGNRSVRLALEVTENIEPKYALAEKYADDYVITKEKYETISFQGKLGVTEYALEQNYPNPFNPVTTIRYQIPKAGRVTLKVYDILGKEIATLVNEEKEIGRYSVNFDASKLSSGVYLYELVANDYRTVKKLMVIK